MNAGNLILSITMIVVSLLFLLFTVYQVKRGKMLLRYSLLWILLSVLILIVAIFPAPIMSLSNLLGFSLTSNFVFSLALFFFLVFCVIQTRAISKQEIKDKQAIQRIALLEKRLEDLEHRENKLAEKENAAKEKQTEETE